MPFPCFLETQHLASIWESSLDTVINSDVRWDLEAREQGNEMHPVFSLIFLTTSSQIGLRSHLPIPIFKIKS
jgi:hypothetical protein